MVICHSTTNIDFVKRRFIADGYLFARHIDAPFHIGTIDECVILFKHISFVE